MVCVYVVRVCVCDYARQAAAVARATMAAESQARKAAEAAEIRRENEEMKKRLANVKSLTDDDISDEAAGAARDKKAAESMARREAKTKALAEQNAAMRARLRNTKAKTDGQRVTPTLDTAPSTQHVPAHVPRFVANAPSATHPLRRACCDARADDVMDEAVGAARATMAAASKDRRAKEAAKLAKANDAMEARLDNVHSKTDDGDGHQF